LNKKPPWPCLPRLYRGWAETGLLPHTLGVARQSGLAGSFDAIILSGWAKTLLFMVLRPLIGLALACGLMVSVYWLFRHAAPKKMDVYCRKLQLLSAGIYSYSHGTNDAQKTMGLITGVLVTAGFQKTFQVPVWVIRPDDSGIGGGGVAVVLVGRAVRVEDVSTLPDFREGAHREGSSAHDPQRRRIKAKSLTRELGQVAHVLDDEDAGGEQARVRGARQVGGIVHVPEVHANKGRPRADEAVEQFRGEKGAGLPVGIGAPAAVPAGADEDGAAGEFGIGTLD